MDPLAQSLWSGSAARRGVANAGIAPTAATFRAMATERFERVIDLNPTSQKTPTLAELFA
jgi:NAD(P)-dependent dehydrogenase (short-subunit alcohol dehydrogenase family)